ncbi:uncharacterized protein B0T23DRAFT_246072 [Neurospora hispaniola]|uniref:DUF7704 domain-containing protein n=1 Tax=Neurospora hispaniola TaxID=588809 RepID=A0AAJ0HZU9_9PEZI|nr:hypothetical protein B0T23DRAFT_246072 [Neurospora hispaniola]
MAPTSPTATASATATIPFLYRIILLYIEPLFAINGAFMVFFQPAKYAAMMTRASVPYDAPSQYLYTQIGSGWLYFAFIQAVILRLYDDLRLWQLLCVGMLLSDAGYSWSVIQGVGGWSQWIKVGEWEASDWTLFWATVPLAVIRVLVLLQSMAGARKGEVRARIDEKRK